MERRRGRPMDVDPVPVHRLTPRSSIHQRQPIAPVLVPALVILFGFMLRIATLGVDARFHPDEALFAAQARLVAGDPLLRNTDLDKPPLTLYVTALAFRLWEPTETAARLPNVLFSGLSLAVLYALAKSLYHDMPAALLAVGLWALAPFDLAFAATVFTDVQTTFWTLTACLLAVRDRWELAGVAAALMFACKPTAPLFLPLILALGIARNARPGWNLEDVGRRLGRFVWPLGLGIGLVVLWDLTRAPRSFLELGFARNNPGRLIRSDEIGLRLKTWGRWLGYITGTPPVSGALLPVGAGWLAYGALSRRTRAASLDWLIAGFSAAFLAWHWLIAFNTYDRYLHTLIPFLLLLAGRSLGGLGRMMGQRPTWAAGIIGLALILPGVGHTLDGQITIGGDQGKHAGIDTLAAYINTHLAGQTVYDHWLGWELAFYLGETPAVHLAYAPLPEALADEMAQQPDARYLVAPCPLYAAPWLDALHRAGINTAPLYHDQYHNFIIYRLWR